MATLAGPVALASLEMAFRPGLNWTRWSPICAATFSFVKFKNR